MSVKRLRIRFTKHQVGQAIAVTLYTHTHTHLETHKRLRCNEIIKMCLIFVVGGAAASVSGKINTKCYEKLKILN